MQQEGNEAERLIENLVDWLSLATIEDMVKAGLHESLTKVINKIHDIGGAISRSYFEFNQERVIETLRGNTKTQSQSQSQV